MNEEQQNKTIAKYCGWRQSKSSMWEGWWHEKNKHTYQRFCPDYCNDLNAMHEAEKTLVFIPERMIGRSTRSEYEVHLHKMYGDFRDAISATAAQRAEAFLKTLKLWEEQ